MAGTVEAGPLDFSGHDALILCDLINNEEYMNELIGHRKANSSSADEPSNEPGSPKEDGPTFEDVDDFHQTRAVKVAISAFKKANESELVKKEHIVEFLKKVKYDETQRHGLAYLVERFQGALRNGASRRTLQSLAMFIEYSVKADNADVLAAIRDGDEKDVSDIRPNRVMW